jgi:hypothetical protein
MKPAPCCCLSKRLVDFHQMASLRTTTMDVLWRRRNHTVAVATLCLVALSAIQVTLHQHWNLYVMVGAFLLVFFPAFTWYVRRSRCLHCRMLLGPAATAAIAPSAKSVPECPHCEVRFDEPVKAT